MSATINYSDLAITIDGGKKATLNCLDKMMKDDVVVSFSTAGGVIEYNNITKNLSAGQTATFHCADKVANSNFVITAYAETEIETAGLFDANGNSVATWSYLVGLGMDISGDYGTLGTGNSARPTNILNQFENGTKLKIGDGFYSIGAYSFSGCNLSAIIISDIIETIGAYAFYGCSNLTSIIIPDFVSSIGEGAFYSCSNLANVTIGNSVESIGGYTFYWCSSLTSVTITANSPPTLGKSAFSTSATGLKIYVPSASLTAYKTAINWSAYADYMEGYDS